MMLLSWNCTGCGYMDICLLLLLLSISAPSRIPEIILIHGDWEALNSDVTSFSVCLAFKIYIVDILHTSMVLFECCESSSTHKICGVFLFDISGTWPCWLFQTSLKFMLHPLYCLLWWVGQLTSSQSDTMLPEEDLSYPVFLVSVMHFCVHMVLFTKLDKLEAWMY